MDPIQYGQVSTCERFPPVPMQGYGDIKWPQTDALERCGEWKAKGSQFIDDLPRPMEPQELNELTDAEQ